MNVIPDAKQDEIITLFKKNKTVSEISDETKIDKQTILEFLTKNNYWSEFCSECKIKRCYDCIGLKELGKPISVQDRIDFIVQTRKKC